MKTLYSVIIALQLLLVSSVSYPQFTNQEKAGLLFTLQEEKAAFDFYTEMFNKYNQKVFENILSAEKVHQEHVLALLTDLNIDPEGYNHAAGEFSNKEIKDLYDLLMKTGAFSFTDALLASARYEEKDISDLRNLYSKAENEKIKALFACLDNASQNHLRAFVKNLKKEGIDFSPSILSADEFKLIIEGKNQPGECFQTK
ncbi:MAG: DUF2202 domain-containing protein [Bacteroidetes bacterium]|nr:DUF2202 domain-containing protein [Bacteroidota bacterium]